MEYQVAEHEGIVALRVELENMRADHAQELLNFESRLEKLRKKLISSDKKQEAKLASLKKRIKNSRREIRTLKESIADKESNAEELEMRKKEGIELASDATVSVQLKTNTEMISNLKIENTRLKSEQAKYAKKMNKLTEQHEILKERCSNLGDDFSRHESQTQTQESVVDNLKNQLNDTKQIHRNMQKKVLEQQEKYMVEAKARFELQKTMAQIMNMLYNGCKKTAIVEEAQSIGFQAESVFKAEIANAEAKDEPSVAVTDVSDTSESS